MSLDLLYPGEKTQELVEGLSDDWVINGPIRAAVHLSAVWHLLQPKVFKWDTATCCSIGGKATFAPVDLNHPWVKWAMDSHEHYGWLYYYAVDLCTEYERRFGFKPYIASMLELYEGMPDAVPESGWTDPDFAKDIKYE
jgi:hypothetical protein